MPGDRGRATHLATPSCGSSRGTALWQSKGASRGMSHVNWKLGEQWDGISEGEGGRQQQKQQQQHHEGFLPLLRQLSDLSDRSVDEEILLRQGKLERQQLGASSASAAAAGAGGVGKSAAVAAAAAAAAASGSVAAGHAPGASAAASSGA
ncbi:unnamed protein product, partial [Ectocarpus sp. 12 AP-2014]